MTLSLPSLEVDLLPKSTSAKSPCFYSDLPIIWVLRGRKAELEPDWATEGDPVCNVPPSLPQENQLSSIDWRHLIPLSLWKGLAFKPYSYCPVPASAVFWCTIPVDEILTSAYHIPNTPLHFQVHSKTRIMHATYE